MKTSKLLSVLMFLYITSMSQIKADEVSCDQYVMSVMMWPNQTMSYDLIDRDILQEQEIFVRPQVDSAWISEINTSNILYITYAQPCDTFDVSFLETGRYFLTVRAVGCIFRKWFTYRDSSYFTENIQPSTDEVSTQKILHNGQILIQRNGIVFDVLGRRLK